jgi:predicted RNase H-like HicB family nuclease
MVKSYTAKYTKIDSGYMGQLIEWPEVITEGHGIEECRSMLRAALREMVLAYQQQGKEIPSATDLFEQVSVELLPSEGVSEVAPLRLVTPGLGLKPQAEGVSPYGREATPMRARRAQLFQPGVSTPRRQV